MKKRNQPRPVNWHRGLEPGALTRRYRKVRNKAPDPGALIPEEQEENVDDGYVSYQARVAGAWRWFTSRRNRWDNLPETFDEIWFRLQRLILEAEPFNPVRLPVRLSTSRHAFTLGEAPFPTANPASLGERLVALGKRLEAERFDRVRLLTRLPDPTPLEERLVDHFRALRSGIVFLQPDLGGRPNQRDDLAFLRHVSRTHLGNNLDALVALLLCSPFWLRPLQEWRPPDERIQSAVLRSLIDHVLVVYPVPAFLYAAWGLPWQTWNAKWVAWFILLAQGGSFARVGPTPHPELWREDISWPSTRLAARFRDVPETLGLADAVMWAEVARLGGSAVEFRRLCRNPAYRIDPTSPPPNEVLDYWRRTVTWLARHRAELIDQQCVGILEWATHVFLERGHQFSWTGRTVRSATAAATEYLELLQRTGRRRWKKHGWDWTEETSDYTWEIRELTSSDELSEESREMRHCVALYDDRCALGHAAIFSVRRDGLRALTVEVNTVNTQHRAIVQARGVFNRSASDFEMAVLRRWQAHLLGLGKRATR